MPAISAFTGSNHPPSAIESAAEFFTRLSAFLADHPAVTGHEEARAFKEWADRARMVVGDLEVERDGKVRPLNEQVREINAEYKATSSPLSRLVDDLKARLAAFIRAEEDRRRQEAEAARRKADEEARIAREKLAAEEEAKANAEAGEVVDLGGKIAETDAAILEAQRAENAARRAERDADNTRIGGGFGRAASLRTVETWTVTDAIGAILEIGTTPGIEGEIVKAAKAWRKLHGKVPAGVAVETERKL